jgi:hypothetical protein
MNRTGPLDPTDDKFRVVEVLPGNNDNDNNVVKYNSAGTSKLPDIECDVLSYQSEDPMDVIDISVDLIITV